VTKHPQIWGCTFHPHFQNFDKFFCDKTSPTPMLQNSLVYTMISPVVVIVTIYRYIADKQKKLSVTKHPHDAAATAAVAAVATIAMVATIAAITNHAKFVDFTKICQPTNTLMQFFFLLFMASGMIFKSSP
jgi:hypothetical protein